MRIFRNVTHLETVLKEKSHWAIAMYGCLDNGVDNSDGVVIFSTEARTPSVGASE